MKLLPITSKELIPGAAFCWQSSYDLNRTVVRVEGDKLVYRIENAAGVFFQRLETLGTVYLVCPTAGARVLLRRAMRLRRIAKEYQRYHIRNAANIDRGHGMLPAAIALHRIHAGVYETMAFHYEDQIQALLAGVYPVTIQNLPPALWYDRIGRILGKLRG